MSRAYGSEAKGGEIVGTRSKVGAGWGGVRVFFRVYVGGWVGGWGV